MALAEYLRSKLDHRWSRGRLSDYLDGELRLGERRRLERHADICPECGPALRTLAVVVSELRRLRRPRRASIAPRVVERLRQRVDGEPGIRSDS